MPNKQEEHRGRFQVQGGGIEESISWSQDTPLTGTKALEMLEELKRRLSPREQKLRASSFTKAEQFIENARNKNGVDAQVSKTFKVKGTRDSRIDIEVIKDKAFVEVENED